MYLVCIYKLQIIEHMFCVMTLEEQTVPVSKFICLLFIEMDAYVYQCLINKLRVPIFCYALLVEFLKSLILICLGRFLRNLLLQIMCF